MTEPPALDATATITDLILNDHEWFRRRFAALDDLRTQKADADGLRMAWEPLAARLDLHAIAEEEIFYPKLLQVGDDDAEDDTIDAIGDHNDIRDGVHAANDHPIGSDPWWDAVREAREANDEHMAEEERDGIPNFKQGASDDLQHDLGRQFADYLTTHRSTDGVDTEDKDPKEYVQDNE